MRRPPARVIATVLAVAVLALAAFAAAVAFAPFHMRLTSWIVAGEIAVAYLAAWRVPVPLATRTLDSVGTTAFLLATVLLPMPLAMAGMALVCVLVDAKRRVPWRGSGRVPWYDTTFNTAQSVLRVAVGATVFRAVAGITVLTGTLTPRLLLAVGLAGLAMYATNKILVHTIVSVQAGRWQARALRRLMQTSVPQEGSLLLLGVLGAMIAGPAPVAVAVPLAATVIIHRELALAGRNPPVELIDDTEQAAVVAAPPSVLSVASLWFGAS